MHLTSSKSFILHENGVGPAEQVFRRPFFGVWSDDGGYAVIENYLAFIGKRFEADKFYFLKIQVVFPLFQDFLPLF